MSNTNNIIERLEQHKKDIEIIYNWIQNLPIPGTKIAKSINLTYQQYRYKIKTKTLTNFEIQEIKRIIENTLIS